MVGGPAEPGTEVGEFTSTQSAARWPGPSHVSQDNASGVVAGVSLPDVIDCTGGSELLFGEWRIVSRSP